MEGLSKTKDSLLGGLKQIFGADGTAPSLSKEQIAEIVHDTLIKSDVGLKTANQLTDRVKQYLHKSNQDTSISSLKQFLKKEMVQILQQRKFDISLRTNHKPIITLIVGVNGSGKTTTTAKLANFYKNQMQMDVTIGAADVTRAAAVSQLVEWAHRVDVPIFFQQPNSTTSSTAKVVADKVVLDTILFAQERMKHQGPDSTKKHLVIIDTAGRLQNNTVQMKELEFIYEAAQKARRQSPDFVLLVIDATTGQSAVEHAKFFAQKTRVNGIIVTKLDGTAKGGVLFSIVNDLRIPVAFMGLGEQLDDLKPFDAEQFVDSILAFETEEQFSKEEKLEIKI